MNSKFCTECYNPDIDRLIYKINYTIDKLSAESIKQVAFGYSCDKNAEAKIETLLSYKHVLTSENRNINFGGEPCLSKFKLQSLSEKINKLTAGDVLEYEVVSNSDCENILLSFNLTKV